MSDSMDTSSASGSGAAAASSSSTIGVKRGKQSLRANDTKRHKKLVQRCTSPSHFNLTEEETQAAASSSADRAAPERAPASMSSPAPAALSTDPHSASASSHHSDVSRRVDSYLQSIASMYYRSRDSYTRDASNTGEVWIASDYDKIEYPTLDVLLSPLRKPNVLDNWCPREIALFESGICSFGKNFHSISRLISTKSCKECIDFYYIWKTSAHYALWKQSGKSTRPIHANKEAQWKAIREQIKSTPTASSKVKEEGKENGVKHES